MNHNVYVIGLDMEGKDAETIARQATDRISELFDRLLEEQQQGNEKKDEQ